MIHLRMNKLDTLELARKLGVINTVRTVQKTLNVKRARAIYLLYKLRKEGFVKTDYQSNKTRVYYISPSNAIGGTSYLEILNEGLPPSIGLLETEIHKIHGRTPSYEEVLIYALEQNSVRHVIASLALFRKIKNWSELYKRAKEKDLVRAIGALYDVARLYLPKLKKMPKRFRNLAMPKGNERYKYIIPNFDSQDFKEIEKKWRVYIPLNMADLFEYRYLRK